MQFFALAVLLDYFIDRNANDLIRLPRAAFAFFVFLRVLGYRFLLSPFCISKVGIFLLCAFALLYTVARNNPNT